jgi:hypothetical protein
MIVVTHGINAITVSSCVLAISHVVPLGSIVIAGCARYGRCVCQSG